MNVHRATYSCSVELYKQGYTFADFLSNWDISRGFSFILYVIDIAGYTPKLCFYCVRGFFLYSILFAGKISKAAMCGAEVGDIIFHSIGRPEIIVYLE